MGDDAFVTPLRCYATERASLTLTGSLQEGHRFHVSGSLTDWQRHVAGLALQNSNAMFHHVLAAIGPILRLANASGAGFHLVGPSSTGKTSVLVAAGSVWGGDDSPLGFSRGWLATRNGLDPLATAHNECFLGLDEAKLAGETPEEAAKTILHAVHRLAGGQEKVRQTDRGPGLQWRVPYLGSSEETLDEMAKVARQTITWGHRVRGSDIRADAGRGMGVWEELHSPSRSPAAFADRLRKAAHEYHGVAGHAFLLALVEAVCTRREWVGKFVHARMKAYLKAVGAHGWNAAQVPHRRTGLL